MAGAAGGEQQQRRRVRRQRRAQAGSPSARRSAGSRRAAGSPDAVAVRVRGAVQHPGQSHRGDAARGFLSARRGSSGHGQAPAAIAPRIAISCSSERSIATATKSPRPRPPPAARRGAGHALMQRRVVQRGVFGDQGGQPRPVRPGPTARVGGHQRGIGVVHTSVSRRSGPHGSGFAGPSRRPLRGARQRSGWSYSAQRHRRIAFELALGSSSRKARASAGVGGSVGARRWRRTRSRCARAPRRDSPADAMTAGPAARHA